MSLSHHNQLHPGRGKIAWIGPCLECYDWLRARLQSVYGEIVKCDCGSPLAAVDRIVVACPDRLSLPSTSDFPMEMPVALAASNWWDGSGRTGMMELPYPLIPWYRWWDGWVPWLEGYLPELLSPFPPRLVHSRLPSGTANCGPTIGWIIANCAQTASSWQLSAAACGAYASKFSLAAYNAMLAGQDVGRIPDWILWDDTCIDTWNNPHAEDLCSEFFLRSKSRFAGTFHVAAFTLPSWRMWQTSFDCGADEFIAKPSTGVVLGKILGTHFRH